MPSKLTKAEQLLVAQRLAEEYRYLGVNTAGALWGVSRGDWDDHPLALALLARRRPARGRRRTAPAATDGSAP